jgi:uncharacterized protein
MGFTSSDIKAVIGRYHQHLTSYREALNALNVYPVPDGDTGTNMALTMGSVVEAVDSASTMMQVTTAMAHGSLMGARGNSGVILSQILRGLATRFETNDVIGPTQMAEALAEASAAAYRAVSRPVEGTILSVLREASEEAVAHASGGDDIAAHLDRIHQRAVAALRSTPDLLPVLKQAGVVDAGAAGLVLLLGSFLEVADGPPASLPSDLVTARPHLPGIGEGTPVGDLRYEVMFFLETDDAGVDRFRRSWEQVGDSIVVVGGAGLWNCHIHTDDIGGAIEAAVDSGRPRDIRVTDLREQVGAHPGLVGFVPSSEALGAVIGVVAVGAGQGVIDIFAQLGCQGVVIGGQTMNPSTTDLLEAVEDVAAGTVIVLPNNKNIVPVAEQVDALTTKRVVVVPTRSIQQGIAALFGYDPGTTDLEGTLEDMAAAASSVVDGEITRAVRDATVGFGPINRGDWIGIADGSILVADPDLEAALRGLVAAILPPGAELLTVLVGEAASTATTKALVAWMSELHPRMRVSIVEGGQPLYPYLVSIE